MKETYKGLEFHKLLISKDDLEIRKVKFQNMREIEKLANKIWKLKQEQTNLKTQVTKLEKRERELLGFPEIDKNE